MRMTVLIVDDEAGLRSGLSKLLALRGYRVLEASTCAAARAALGREAVHIVLLDVRLGAENGLDLLAELRADEPMTSVIVVTGYGDVKGAVACMRQGAINYLTKPVDHELLVSVLEREREALLSRQENLAFRESLEDYAPQLLAASAHPEVQRLDDIVGRIKDSEATVLIEGETGTGKEVLARRIHHAGSYRERPFIAVNCAALNENLLESELFGHEKGAFTDAIGRKLGRFELAGRGTLFLDEIGDMSLAMQSKLLRVLQEGTFERVGGTQTLRAGCRVMAATNRELSRLMAQGTFRADLFYRLSVIRVRLPPLRERPDDIAAFVALFIAEANRRYNRGVRCASPALVERLARYPWPGNIRQLRNVIVNAVILSDGDEIARVELPDDETTPEDQAIAGIDLKTALADNTRRFEERMIRAALARHGGNISRTAAQLGITRKTLYEKVRQYGL
jgi:DNA-binding NtrC family response regulator